jgi:hypothetical protein
MISMFCHPRPWLPRSMEDEANWKDATEISSVIDENV